MQPLVAACYKELNEVGFHHGQIEIAQSAFLKAEGMYRSMMIVVPSFMAGTKGLHKRSKPIRL